MTTLALRHTTGIGNRHLRALLRQPYYVAIQLLQPMIWLVLFGQLFKGVAHSSGTPYIAYLTPGVVVMNTLFSNGWSGMSILHDIDRGVMSRFLVSPISRGALVVGQLSNVVLTTLVQSLVILVVGFAMGARYTGGTTVVLALLLAASLLGATFAAMSDALALRLRQEESVIAAVTFIVLPLSFLSTALLPAADVTPWIRDVAAYNPVNWAAAVAGQVSSHSADWPTVLGHLGLLAALFAAALGTAIGSFRAYERST